MTVVGAAQFSARLDNVRVLSNLLSSIALHEEIVICSVQRAGLKFVAQQAKSIQALTFLDRKLFHEYQLDFEGEAAVNADDSPSQCDTSMMAQDQQEDASSSELTFAFQLQPFLQCLNIFGNATPLKMGTGDAFSGSREPPQGVRHVPAASQMASQATYAGSGGSGGAFLQATVMKVAYQGPGHDLELILEERGVITSCRFATFENESEVMDLEFGALPIAAKLIIRSEWLREAFASFDPSSQFITFAMSPTEPYFRILSSGIAGSTEIDYSRDTNVIEFFSCQDRLEERYRFQLLAPAIRPLSLSTKTSIRINTGGQLSMQFMIPIENEVAFVEYLCLPSVDD